MKIKSFGIFIDESTEQELADYLWEELDKDDTTFGLPLNEDARANMEKLESAIDNKFVCTIDYRGEPKTKILPGMRVIEPYALGTDKHGNTLLRAWLIRGYSRSGKINPNLVPGWRLFRVDRMTIVTPSLQKFTVPKKGYTAQDSMMKEVLHSATF